MRNACQLKSLMDISESGDALVLIKQAQAVMQDTSVGYVCLNQMVGKQVHHHADSDSSGTKPTTNWK